MADILIRGLEMPKENNATSIIIFSNGKVSLAHDKKYAEYAEAVPLPEGHGRLIDADALREDWLENGENEHVYDTNAMLYSIDNSPTIVPAEGGTESPKRGYAIDRYIEKEAHNRGNLHT